MASKLVRLRNIKQALRLKTNNLDDASKTKYIIGGRVNNFRNYKSFNFIDLSDGSTRNHLQVIVKKNVLQKPELGSYMICSGSLVPSRGTQQDIEFQVDHLDYLSKCDPLKYPLIDTNKNTLTDGWYRQKIHLRPHAPHFASLLRVRSELELAFHMIFKQMDFIRVHTPVLTGNDSEASSDLFCVHRKKQSGLHHQAPSDKVTMQISDDDDDDDDIVDETNNSGPQTASNTRREYFNKDVFMITSAQLHLESLAASLSRVYCLSPAFRAESSLSQRHLCEFQMLEAEESNVTQLDALMDRVESVVKFVAQYLGEISEFSEDFSSLLDKYSNRNVYAHLACSKYIRMTYGDAIKILDSMKGSSTSSSHANIMPCKYGSDINRWHERELLKYSSNVPIFITNYPRKLKPFYMKGTNQEQDNGNDEVACFDLIAPHGGEICGGSLREDDLDKLHRNLTRAKLVDQEHQSRECAHLKSEQLFNQSTDQSNDKTTTSQDELHNRRSSTTMHDDKFSWYLDLREFGSFPHGGFGLGVERLVQSLVGIRNIKDTIAFPRSPGKCPM